MLLARAWEKRRLLLLEWWGYRRPQRSYQRLRW
jgi:hypothetical protein